MNICVRQAKISDKKKIWDFLKKAYAERAKYKFPERWNWEYVNNPFWEGKNLPIWIALDSIWKKGQS